MRRRSVLAGFAAALARGQTTTTRPQVVTYPSGIDNSDQPYALYVPRTYTSDRSWPVIIGLHGEGSSYRVNLLRIFGRGLQFGESDMASGRRFPVLADVDFLVACPLARGDMGYQGIPEIDVLDVLADVKRRFRVDEDRVYLTGIGMGGGGALWLSMTRPDIWAAVAAVCPEPPAGLELLAGNLMNVPTALHQGAIDPLVPAAETRAWSERLKDAGVDVTYVEYPNVRHNAWDFAYRDQSIFKWFGQQRRLSKPQRLHFVSDAYSRSSAYWLLFDRLTPGLPASATAELRDGALKVDTKNLDGFSVDSAQLPARPSAVIIDGSAVRLRPNVWSFVKTPNGWIPGKIGPAYGAKQKRPGAEGPVAAAINAHHIYIYGSRDNPAPAELIRRRDVARHAAEWSTPQRPLQIHFKALSDADATDAQTAGANFVLFGNRITNELIARLSSNLPIHLSPSAADYGLVYVYPADNRYVVVSSGLPWWTRLDQARRPGLPLSAPPWRVLENLGDFILFRGGIDNVIAEGRFDNEWRLPSDARMKILSTGAVEISDLQ